VLRAHGRVRDLVRGGNQLPAPDPMTGLTKDAT